MSNNPIISTVNYSLVFEKYKYKPKTLKGRCTKHVFLFNYFNKYTTYSLGTSFYFFTAFLYTNVTRKEGNVLFNNALNTFYFMVIWC